MQKVKQIAVKCYSGYKAIEKPQFLKVKRKWLKIIKVNKMWIQESKDSNKNERRIYFTVKAIDGNPKARCINIKNIHTYKIFYDNKEDSWYVENEKER